MNEVMAKPTSPGVARPWAQAHTSIPVSPACSVSSSRFWPMPAQLKVFQVRITAARQAAVTAAKRALSRASAPKLFTTALPPMASARLAPILVSSALERRFTGRMKRVEMNRL